MNDFTIERPGGVESAPAGGSEYPESGWPLFVGIVARRRKLIAAITAICVVVAIAYALLATPYYRGETSVTAVKPDTGNASALASDIAGAIGVNLLQSNDEVETNNAILASRFLIEQFITRNSLLPVLSRPGKKPLTLWFAVKEFRDDILTIKNDSKKGVTLVQIEWTDPATAARWANGFVSLANELIRARALDESRRNITYLNGQLNQTSEVEVKRVIYNLIEGETKKAMIANGKVEFAFQTVDPAVTPELRDRPKRTLIVVGATLLGLLLGLGAAFTFETRRSAPVLRS